MLPVSFLVLLLSIVMLVLPIGSDAHDIDIVPVDVDSDVTDFDIDNADTVRTYLLHILMLSMLKLMFDINAPPAWVGSVSQHPLSQEGVVKEPRSDVTGIVIGVVAIDSDVGVTDIGIDAHDIDIVPVDIDNDVAHVDIYVIDIDTYRYRCFFHQYVLVVPISVLMLPILILMFPILILMPPISIRADVDVCVHRCCEGAAEELSRSWPEER